MQYNEVAQYFNLKLKEAIVQLRKDLPLAAITYVDVYSAKYSLASNPNKYDLSTHLRHVVVTEGSTTSAVKLWGMLQKLALM
ncbi:GDSL esterase/lipase [Quillaja saponaria]|uniref:GDSL esterase/lipase n=1 Tax=Quillaja saponaria TaxID=32244 RepID=A0AAD7LWW0_QUISA|nr:GDSL esterase/lipase [Quillaja saponaria]